MEDSSASVADDVEMWNESLKLLSLLPALSSDFHLLVSLFPSQDSLNSMVPAAVVVCYLFLTTWVDACEFQVPFADTLET